LGIYQKNALVEIPSLRNTTTEAIPEARNPMVEGFFAPFVAALFTLTLPMGLWQSLPGF
jgi:hypothetical protein